jgi:O-antigen/teichoic acid export membrane protein
MVRRRTGCSSNAESMLQKLKRLGSDSMVYGLGGIAARAIGVVMLPIYTRILAPADYGDIEMLAVLGAFFGAFLSTGMEAAQSFYFFEQKVHGVEAQARVVSAIAQWRLSWGLVLVGVATSLTPLLNRTFFDGRLAWYYFALIFFSNWVVQFVAQATDVFRLTHRPWSYLAITLTSTLASTSTAILFVAVLRWGVLGFVIGSAVGASAAAIVGWWKIREYMRFSTWHREWWPRILKFGTPLLPGALAMYVLNTSDRWFISYFHGPEPLGIFAVGARFAGVISIAVVTFRKAWSPIAMESLQSDDGPQLLRFMARAYLGVTAIGIIILTVAAPWLVRLLTAPAYHDAYAVVGILAWPAALYGLFSIVSAGTWKKEKTFWLPLAMGAGALTTVLLSLILVPKYGAIGAAVAHAVAFLVWNGLTVVMSERLWPVGHSLGVFALQVAIGAMATGAIIWLYRSSSSLWYISACAIVSCGMLMLISVDPETSDTIKTALRRRSDRRRQATLVR